MKRFAADQVDLGKLPLPEIENRPEKVAVVGSGPAGLTVAYYLRLKGYQVTLIEMFTQLGGMLRVGIPDYRLPAKVLDSEIDYLLRHGIEVRTRMCFGKDFSLTDLRTEGFQAIFLGIGAHESIVMRIPGEEASKNVVDAISFLRDVNLGHDQSPGRRVVVIGGGNVAIDAARVAKRLGAIDVTVVYRRSEREVPAYPEEIEGAREEGIAFSYLTAPVSIQSRDGRVTGFECQRTELGPPDASGRRRPVPVPGSEFVIDCDTVIPAIGQSINIAWSSAEPDLELTTRGTFQVNHETLQTSVPDVFAAGDAVTGPATVVEAISAGHKAVAAMDRYLNNYDLQPEATRPAAEESPLGKDWQPIADNIVSVSRVSATQLDPKTRDLTFDEVDLSFDTEAARREADRCVDCGGCCECRLCETACEAGSVNHAMTDRATEIEVGSIIVATGFDPLDPTPMTQYGYGRYANVFTNLEFERLSNATGPTAGRLLKRDPDNRLKYTDPPKSAAILHCIGSRDINHHEYCSRTCCMYALKYAHLLKDKCGHDTEIYNFYIDMRCFGKGYEEFYKRVQSEGVRMVRGKAARVEEQNGSLVVTAEDSLSARIVQVPVDMVILCTAMEPRPDANEVTRIFGITTGSDGFFQEEHPKLEPVSTASSGIFLAGACRGPKDIPDTVAQAKGAAAEALVLSASGEVAVSPLISSIDHDICIGCRMCMELCPYSAIEFNDLKNVSEVNEAVCKGCGSCAGHCPSGAARVRHFTSRQVFAEIEGILTG